MAAQSLGSMKVIVQPENASFVVATSEHHQGSAYRDPVRLGGSQDQTVDRDQPGRHAGFALQPGRHAGFALRPGRHAGFALQPNGARLES